MYREQLFSLCDRLRQLSVLGREELHSAIWKECWAFPGGVLAASMQCMLRQRVQHLQHHLLQHSNASGIRVKIKRIPHCFKNVQKTVSETVASVARSFLILKLHPPRPTQGEKFPLHLFFWVHSSCSYRAKMLHQAVPRIMSYWVQWNCWLPGPLPRHCTW